MKNKLVSIAMATYNGEKYVKEQLDSILNQTYRNLEIIICDDNSTDDTFKILEDYSKKDKRIKLYRNKKNLGFVKNFEKAIFLCKGEYIALSDQDDIWMEDKIEILLDEINNFDLIHTDAYLIDEKGIIISKSFSRSSNKMIYPESIVDLVLNGCVTGCTCMFSRKLRNFALPFPEDLYIHDKWLGINAYYLNSIKYLDKPLIKYRQHSNNQIGAGINKLNLEKVIKFFTIKKNKCELFKNLIKLINIILSNLQLDTNEKEKLILSEKYYNYRIKNQILLSFIYHIYLFNFFDKNKSKLNKFFNLINIFRIRCVDK